MVHSPFSISLDTSYFNHKIYKVVYAEFADGKAHVVSAPRWYGAAVAPTGYGHLPTAKNSLIKPSPGCLKCLRSPLVNSWWWKTFTFLLLVPAEAYCKHVLVMERRGRRSEHILYIFQEQWKCTLSLVPAKQSQPQSLQAMHCMERRVVPFKRDGKMEGKFSLRVIWQESTDVSKNMNIQKYSNLFCPGKKSLVSKSVFLFSEICFLRCQKKICS